MNVNIDRSGRRHRRRRVMTRAVIIAATALSALATTRATGAEAAPLPALTCSAHALPARIADPGPASQVLWGQLCYRGPHQPATVQLLVHGATYDHRYWDFPYGGGYYSYVDAATAAGYATFNVDRIGDGNSSHPASSELGLAAGAVALHDAVTALRSGAVAGHSFRHVIMVGHSIGSFEAWYEAGRYHDVDAVIITGALHEITANVGAIEGNLYPAAYDPAFAADGLDMGYLTSQPGTRGSMFYSPATASPAVVAADEATKDTAVVPELSDATTVVSEPAAQQPAAHITVPVLSVVGEEDNLFCAAVTAYNCADPRSVSTFESGYYSPQARLKVIVIPGTGHDLALSTTAPVTDAVMTSWSLLTVAP